MFEKVINLFQVRFVDEDPELPSTSAGCTEQIEELKAAGNELTDDETWHDHLPDLVWYSVLPQTRKAVLLAFITGSMSIMAERRQSCQLKEALLELRARLRQ